MLDLSEITSRAREAPRQSTDVEVVFDAGLTEELDSLRTARDEVAGELAQVEADAQAELEEVERDRRASDPRPTALKKRTEKQTAPLNARLDHLAEQIEAVQAKAADFVVTFRFTALHQFEWDDLCAQSVPREDHPEDAGRDYNMDEVCRIAATRTGVRVVDDGTVPVTAEQWADVWAALHRLERRAIKLAIFTLNEYSGVAAHTEAVAAARKVSAAREAASQTSLSTSGSTRAASTGGNPSPSRTTSTTTQAA